MGVSTKKEQVPCVCVRQRACDGYIAYVPQKLATKSILPRAFWKSEPTRPGSGVFSMCMPDSAEPRACASTVRELITPVSGLYSFAVALVGSSYFRKPLFVSVGLRVEGRRGWGPVSDATARRWRARERTPEWRC